MLFIDVICCLSQVMKIIANEWEFLFFDLYYVIYISNYILEFIIEVSF